MPSIPAVAEQDVIAYFNDTPITRSEVEKRAANKLYRLNWEIFDALKAETQALVEERLLAEEARRRGMSVEDLLREEVKEKTSLPTQELIDSYMEEHRLKDKTNKLVRNRVAAYLADRAEIDRRLQFMDRLRMEADYRFLLEPPERPRVEVSIDDDPVRGNPDAPITIIHFASFSCEICAESARRIERLSREFPEQIRWIHRDFLNLFDELGLRAAEAGETAKGEGLFWEFHDRAYMLSEALTEESLRQVLEESGVDPSLYEQAHAEARHIPEIKHDIEDGVKAGVTSVPVVFVNGRYVSGTFTYEKLKAIVEEELQSRRSEEESEKAMQQR